MPQPKITIVGAGNVGATTAHLCAIKNLGKIVLVDIQEGVPQGKALDIKESLPLLNVETDIVGANDYESTKDSDIVVITAGLPRKPGMSREELIQKNARIIKSVTEQAVKYSPNCILIVVTNPLDVMVYQAAEASGFDKKKVMGMAGLLDTARFKTFIAEALNVPFFDIEAMVLGSHGDLMVPIISQTKAGGKLLSELVDENKLAELVRRTRDGGMEIVNYLKTGSAYYAPAAAVVEMIKAILRDEKNILPITSYLSGEYGISDLYLGVPSVLGKDGVEKVVEIEMSERERRELRLCAIKVKMLVESL